jgi:hypothetical protein
MVFNYLTGVTSNIQSQINDKQDIINSSNKINSEFIGNGSITNTVFNYLNGVTSNIQNQLNNLIGRSTNDLIYCNNAIFTDLETNNVTFHTTNNFVKFVDTSTSTKLFLNNIYSISGAVFIAYLKFAQSITLRIRLKSNNVLISESTSNNTYAYFEYNGTNNSEFEIVTLIYPEFIFKSNSNYTNISVEYYINYTVDSKIKETVQFNCTMNLKRLY